MTWLLLLFAVSMFAVPRFVRRRRELFPVLPSEPISILNMALARRRTAQTRAALDAATQALR